MFLDAAATRFQQSNAFEHDADQHDGPADAAAQPAARNVPTNATTESILKPNLYSLIFKVSSLLFFLVFL